MGKPRNKTKPSTRPDWASMISRLRQGLGLSQTAFGHEVHSSAMGVSRWERGAQEPPSHSYIELWHKEVGLTVSLVSGATTTRKSFIRKIESTSPSRWTARTIGKLSPKVYGGLVKRPSVRFRPPALMDRARRKFRGREQHAEIRRNPYHAVAVLITPTKFRTSPSKTSI
jgi:transcriptional regulator with XRE-family HTH domain